jgi:hypothetical protein
MFEALLININQQGKNSKKIDENMVKTLPFLHKLRALLAGQYERLALKAIPSTIYKENAIVKTSCERH